MVQIACSCMTGLANSCSTLHHYPARGYTIPFNAVQIHGITTERALEEGKELTVVLEKFAQAVAQSSMCVATTLVLISAYWERSLSAAACPTCLPAKG